MPSIFNLAAGGSTVWVIVFAFLGLVALIFFIFIARFIGLYIQGMLAKAEVGGRHLILANGSKRSESYQMLWDPIFSPDGKHVLLRYVDDDKYCRQVTPVGELLG